MLIKSVPVYLIRAVRDVEVVRNTRCFYDRLMIGFTSVKMLIDSLLDVCCRRSVLPFNWNALIDVRWYGIIRQVPLMLFVMAIRMKNPDARNKSERRRKGERRTSEHYYPLLEGIIRFETKELHLCSPVLLRWWQKMKDERERYGTKTTSAMNEENLISQ